MNYLLLAVGGAIGTIIRFALVSSTIDYFKQPIFPWGTLLVNLLGSFLIGILAGLNESDILNPGTRTFLFIGLLGGFTTFSAFSLESLQLIRQAQITYALAYVLSSTMLGITLAAGGFFLSKFLLQLSR